MKKKKKTIPRLLAALAAAALLAGCGSSGRGAASSAAATYDMSAAETSEAASAEAAPQEAYGGSVDSVLDPTADTGRKIVYTAYLSMEATDFDGARDALLAAVEANGAYLEYTDQSGSAKEGSRYASYTVRVPADNYRAFLEAAGEAGSLLSMSESAQDITSGYIDVEARLSALENQRDRLNELADKAETTADLLEIESQLSDVQYQLESYTRQLRSMDDQISYSTVEVSLREVATLTPSGVTFGERLRDAFTGGLDAFVGFVQGVILLAVYLLPAIVLAAAAIALAVTLRRRWCKAHPKKPGSPPAPPAAYEAPADEPKPKY